MNNNAKNQIGPIIQRIKGKTQKAIGAIQSETGEPIKGGVNKIKGSVNDTVGKIRQGMSRENRPMRSDDTI